jgi:hypothetical protein
MGLINPEKDYAIPRAGFSSEVMLDKQLRFLLRTALMFVPLISSMFQTSNSICLSMKTVSLNLLMLLLLFRAVDQVTPRL